MSLYKLAIRPILLQFDPETIHKFTFKCFKLFQKSALMRSIVSAQFNVKHPKLERELFGLKFPNPVGLAAGLDKNAEAFDFLGSMGFGFIEIGTVTPKAQAGNPLPRLFRFVNDKALVNRMGFNNEGVEEVVSRLRKKKTQVIIGGNIGKNKLTPNEEATSDYIKCFKALYPLVDYFVVNVSSPNTPNLRELQDKDPLTKLLTDLMDLNRSMVKAKPILLKIAPDLNQSQLDDIIDIVKETKIDGIVSTNTTISRDGLSYPEDQIQKVGAGGLSGQPLRERATEVIRYIHKKSNGSIPIIGVGGIMSKEDALEKLKAGASLIQLYTGFIYEGPALVKAINKELLRKL
ncbi:quinone-dependent dihydroorotate dehydrogenase [Ancylomarina euxinus]|uniref:Dihydroorotate dehydrogenase (quinone) n=1 Tax=Ancylomarina euxinus TaxID=2283627 RepID=A0A425Y2V5_9BACT|nr:quinone-dependent dihydroorotate dehydrogenase [Ancylomarina euxinus]MCZ4694906.1 quinone-dependent dihydroorotate dehydrogenase [Ancylomarina euxinus]MUP14772.1 quinone-dependent dihydroorotate dehydrogenase [Ancylomarina euxinus]RRG22118.1 quinone-dependent dihydroorotate dehydrogenase [Ancylomarina euxinus]